MASDQPPSSSAPDVLIAVELHVPHVAGTGVSLQNQIGHALRDELAGVLALLGIPGPPQVAIASNEDPAADRPLRVFVDGLECGYPNELLRSVYACTLGAHVDAGMPVESMLEAFTDPSGAHAGSANRIVEFVARACVEIVLANRTALFGPAQLASYLASLPRAEDGLTREWDSLWAITALRAVIDEGLSIADRQKVAGLLEESAGKSAADAAECLIAALAPEAIEIHLPSEFLREVTTAHPHDPASLFPLLRDGLFVELGVVYPPFRFVVGDDMQPRTMAFTIGAIATPPVPGLAPDQLLVNDTAERMRRSMEIDAMPASNPATGAPACLIAADRRADARSAGLTTWDNAEHVILSLAAALRRQSSTFVHRRTVQAHLDVLAHAAPALIKHVTRWYRVEQISAVLRGLVAEEVSIRNLRAILESLLESAEAARGQAPSDSTDHIPVADLIAHARRGLCYEIKNQCARGTDTVVVYLLDPALEGMFDGARSVESEEGVAADDAPHAALWKAIETELGTLPKTAQLPALLAAGGARARLRRATAPAFPRLRVIAYEELPPETNVQPVARIALAEAAG